MTLLILAGILLLTLLVSTTFHWLGARLVRASNPSFGRAFLLSLLLTGLSVGVAFAVLKIEESVAAEAMISVVFVLFSLLLIRGLFATTLARTLVIWGMGLVGGAAIMALLFFVIKPLVLEAYVVPSNPMAPTIVGYHRTEACPHCNGSLIVAMSPPRNDGFENIRLDANGICASCLKTSMVPFLDVRPNEPDRIIVNKLMTPKRFDMIVFQHPPNPKTKYMMRLVGLPSEKVAIKDGSLWINDVRIEMPPELATLRYIGSAFPFEEPDEAKSTWQLGPAEHFVLGDFTVQSSDSRDWGAVPGGHIEGVVTLCYWPPSRWRTFE